MNPGWRFYRGDLGKRNFDAIHASRFDSAEWMKAGNHGVSKAAYPDQEWREVDLPHDFVIENEFSPQANQVHGSLPVSVGWYRKVFKLPEADLGKRITLEFDGIYRDCSIWLNGHFVGRELSGYQSFSFDITEICNYGGLNALAVRVDAREFELWSYEGGGIYRDVRLVKTDPVHVAYDGTCVRFEVEHTAAPAEAHGTLLTTVANDSTTTTEAEVVSCILNPEGKEVAGVSTTLQIPALSRGETVQTVTINTPQLWSPDTPQLYTLLTQIQVNGKTIDNYETRFGIRSLKFDAKQGFSINGKSMKLKGVCNHQDHAGVGIAIPDRLQEWRIEQLKAMGCNALRTSHNQPTPALLDICDRHGIMVMDEARMPGATPELMSQMENLIIRDRNHPCII
ncbi:MAG: glycoside hydrolase family 2 TIM barrel-domain containing protein, partial [Verrucomicrobiota bacterium]